MDRAVRNSNKANLDLVLSVLLEMDLGFYNVENPAHGKVSVCGAMGLRCRLPKAICGNIVQVWEYLTRTSGRSRNPRSRSNGYISERTAKTNFFRHSAFGTTSLRLAVSVPLPRKPRRESRPSEKVVEKQVEQEHADVVALIEDQLETLGLFKEYASEREKLVADAEARSFSLPSAEATDKLLRYEAHFDRQLYRAMDQLERLQRQRKGENVPPPLNVNLGRRA